MKIALVTALAAISIAVKPMGAVAQEIEAADVVFNHQTQACDKWDVPDTAARAFRDAQGRVHLIATHFVNRAMIGTELQDVRRHCEPIYEAGRSANPGDFDDEGWLESFYTPDGRTVLALVSMDYHPIRHKMPCAKDLEGCWFSAVTWAVSEDGGNHFSSPRGDGRFVAGPAGKFDSNSAGPRGAFVPTNILEWDGFYYAMISFASDASQKGGDCLARTPNLADPHSWRAWDGAGFNISFVNPYGDARLSGRPCAPVGTGQIVSPIRTLAKTATGKFLSVFLKNTDSGRPAGAYVSYSDDLINWGKPKLILSFKIFEPNKCARDTSSASYSYPSLIDPMDKSRNFNVIGTSAYLYLTRFNNCASPDRDLVRVKVYLPAP